MSARPAPELSVLLATLNRSRLLRRCLLSLASQSLDPARFEVVVIDDGSSDDSLAMAAALDLPFILRTEAIDHAGKSGALNTGIELARGEVCLFLDDDLIASPDLLAAHLAAHEEEPRTLGIGAITQQPVAGRDWYAHAFARGWNEHIAERTRQRISWTDCYGANFSAPREKLLEVGGFKLGLATAEDIEMGFRLEQAGCLPTYLPAAHGVHDDQKSGRRMLADLERQGRAHVALGASCPAMAPSLLAWADGAGEREIAGRRLALALRLPPRLVAALGAVIPGQGRKMTWFHFVRRYAFWRAVKETVAKAEWQRLSPDPGAPLDA